MAVRGMRVTGVKTDVHVTHDYTMMGCFHGAVLRHRFTAQIIGQTSANKKRYKIEASVRDTSGMVRTSKDAIMHPVFVLCFDGLAWQSRGRDVCQASHCCVASLLH